MTKLQYIRSNGGISHAVKTWIYGGARVAYRSSSPVESTERVIRKKTQSSVRRPQPPESPASPESPRNTSKKGSAQIGGFSQNDAIFWSILRKTPNLFLRSSKAQILELLMEPQLVSLFHQDVPKRIFGLEPNLYLRCSKI